MSFVQGVFQDNSEGVVYLLGKENLNGSVRLTVSDEGEVTLERREEGIWIPIGLLHSITENVYLSNNGTFVLTNDRSPIYTNQISET